jgi:hypothetical protein
MKPWMWAVVVMFLLVSAVKACDSCEHREWYNNGNSSVCLD